MSKELISSLVVISFTLGLGTGFVLSPEYAVRMSEKQSMSMELGRTDKFVDQRFIDGVIAHHLNAIYMAKQALENSKRQEIKDLAKEIIAVDEKNIEELYDWKKDWYGNTRQITNYEKINLGTSDENFDLRFLNALIAHHEDAIIVSKEIRTKSNRSEILNLADAIITNLSKGVVGLSKWRSEWYQVN